MSAIVDPKVQRFNRANISMHDFEHAAKFIDAARKHGNETPECEALWIAAIINYARPFSGNEQLPSAKSAPRLRVNAKKILGEQHKLHKRIIELRNKAVAHSEWDFYPTPQIPVPPKSGGFSTVSKRWHPVNEGIDLDAFSGIAKQMQRACLNVMVDLSRASKGK